MFPGSDGDTLHEECGIFGVYAPGIDVARMTFFGLYALQHRGQESAGIAVAHEGEVRLRKRMGLSGGAITYLVERMIASGHLRRESDPDDRRKVILRYDEHGMAVARDFFTPLAEHTRAALVDLPDEDLAAAHRVITALIAAMRAFQTGLEAG